MAILWCEGFDQYGTTEDFMLDGAWGEVSINLSSARARTGTYSLHADGNKAVSRRVLGKSVTTVGVGFGWFTEELPVDSSKTVLVDFRDADNIPNVTVICGSTGTLDVYRGDSVLGTLLGRTSTPAVTAHAWQHIEVKVVLSETVGSVEIRVKGVEVLSLTGIDTVVNSGEVYGVGAGSAECSQIGFIGGPNYTYVITDTNTQSYYDDIVVWDTTGSYNNDWIGDKRVNTLFPSADTATADWTPLSGTGYENIDDASPDDDTTYVYAAAPGSPAESTSEFDVDNLASSSGTIASVSVVSRLRKDEAADADFQNGLVSSSVEVRGATVAANPIYTYHEDVFETDPNTGVAFTPTNVNNLKLQINRVT
jgi:hypothetical protein